MISKAKVRFIKDLQVKKYRLAEQCFLVQGAKAVKETLASDFEVPTLLGTKDFLGSLDRKVQARVGETLEVSEKILTSVSSVETNNSALAVVRMKVNQPPQPPFKDFLLVLDDIRDPGNLGTIIRTADWFGIRNIVASPETTDVYNAKVINATMGSFLRVDIFYTPLSEWLSTFSLPVYGTFLTGEDIHTVRFPKSGILVMGNESRGISAEVEKLITHRITVPRYGKAESLYASTAAAIVLDNLCRGL